MAPFKRILLALLSGPGIASPNADLYELTSGHRAEIGEAHLTISILMIVHRDLAATSAT